MGFLSLKIFLRFIHLVYINIPFLLLSGFSFLDISRFVYPFTCWSTFGLFQVWAIVVNAALNIWCKSSCGHTFSFFLDKPLKVGSMDPMFNFLRYAMLTSGVVVPFCFPPAKFESCHCTTSSTLAISIFNLGCCSGVQYYLIWF